MGHIRIHHFIDQSIFHLALRGLRHGTTSDVGHRTSDVDVGRIPILNLNGAHMSGLLCYLNNGISPSHFSGGNIKRYEAERAHTKTRARAGFARGELLANLEEDERRKEVCLLSFCLGP